ncbi:permease-like cell division protein FtsX [Fusobacterium sp.]|uniref:cell division protein FtsX n=1 Tax=Fusobacterium sp. TaxID=68766 RepID=UPI0026087940|nr:permease-like cell division protein FtsX [Fusobacterium sp.]
MFNVNEKREIKKFAGVKRGFLTIIAITFIFNIFFAGFLNISSQVNELKGKNFIMAELQNSLSQSNKEELERKLLSLKEVQKVIYIDSYTAFQDLQKNLGIVIPRGENPLPDTLRIYFKKAEDVEKLQSVLEESQGIKEFFVDGIYISEINNRVKVLNLFGIIFGVGMLCSLFTLSSIFKSQIEADYLMNIIVDDTNPRNYIKAKNVNLLPFTVSTLIGLLLFFNFYVIIRKGLIRGNIFMDLLSLLQIFYFQVGVTIFVIILAWFVPTHRKIGVRK